MKTTKSMTISLTALSLSFASLTLVAEAPAAPVGWVQQCQQALLNADVRLTKCRDRCERQQRAECTIKCEKSFKNSAQKPLACIGERIIRHVRVPARAGWVDTGVYTPQYGTISILAVGSSTYMPGGPAVGSRGTPNSANDPRTLAPRANLGALVLSDPVFAYDDLPLTNSITFTNVEPRRMFLAINDNLSGYGDNTGYLDVSVMVEGVTRAEVTVPANEWVDSKIFKGPNTYVQFQGISGAWTNVVGGTMLGAAGYAGYVHPGTMLPDVDLAALAGSIGSKQFWIGAGVADLTPEKDLGPFRFGMNDVVGTLHDNSGEMKLEVWSGSWPVW